MGLLLIKIAVPLFSLLCLYISFKIDKKVLDNKIRDKLTPEQEKKFELYPEEV